MKRQEQVLTFRKQELAQLLEEANNYIEKSRHSGNKKKLREAKRKKRNYEMNLLQIDKKGAAL